MKWLGSPSVGRLLRPSARSFRTTLAIYFLPLSLIPMILVGVYAVKKAEEAIREPILRRAQSEKDSLLTEVESRELALLNSVKKRAASRELHTLLRKKDIDLSVLLDLRPEVWGRLYGVDGRLKAEKRGIGKQSPPLMDAESMRRVRIRGLGSERLLTPGMSEFVMVSRSAIRNGDKLIGFWEESIAFGDQDLAEVKLRRGLDLIFLDQNKAVASGSLAIAAADLVTIASQGVGRTSDGKPQSVRVGETRFATFVYDFPFKVGRTKSWGYLCILIPMNSIDEAVSQLKSVVLYSTVLIAMTSAFLIILVSNRVVQPIDRLVQAMQGIKTGNAETLVFSSSAYEIEYLVHSFNEMSQSMLAAKRALEQKVDELAAANSEIKQTQSTLVQSAKMVSLGQLVAGVAHELNNPIAYIYSNLHELTDYVVKIRTLVAEYRRIKQELPLEAQKEWEELDKKYELDFILKDIEELAKSCMDGANRTKDIVLGLRSFSRTEDMGLSLLDVHEGIRGTIRLLRNQWRDRITIHEEFGDTPLVEANPSQLNQVWMNLIANAVQAISGRGNIWIRTSRYAHGDGENIEGVRIEIRDDGVGMEDSVLSKIFDPFFTTKKVGQGTGLGLSISYAIVQRHQGRIEVESRPGEGTAFIVWLPARQAIQASA